MTYKSAEWGKAANGIMSIAGAAVAYQGITKVLTSGHEIDSRGLFVGGTFVFIASVVRVIVTSFVPGRLRFGASLISLVITAGAGIALMVLGGSAWTLWATLLLAFAPLAQDLLTPDPERMARIVPEGHDPEPNPNKTSGEDWDRSPLPAKD